MAALRVFLLLAVLLFCFADVSTVDGEVENSSQVVKGANRRLMNIIDCDKQCEVRCGDNSRPNYCHRACGTCCKRCACVPPGTSGNREVCGTCYMDMTTHRNQTKCP